MNSGEIYRPKFTKVVEVNILISSVWKNSSVEQSRWVPVGSGGFLRGQLHGVPVAAVQRALRRRAVLGFELWPHRVDDESRRQVEAFGQLGLAGPAPCTKTHTRLRDEIHA